MCLSTVSLPSSLPAGLELRSGGSCLELELSETDNNSKHSGVGASLRPLGSQLPAG